MNVWRLIDFGGNMKPFGGCCLVVKHQRFTVSKANAAGETTDRRDCAHVGFPEQVGIGYTLAN